MQSLWFLTDGVRILAVYSEEREAQQELEKYEDDPDYQYYQIYELDIDELEDYPDEYDLAMNEGFLG